MNFEKINDKEYMLGINRVTLIENNIIYVQAKGPQTYEMSLAYKEICHLIYANVEGKINYLINLNECSKNESAARETWKDLSSEDKTNKAATFGLNPVARVIASFVIGTYGNDNLRFFKSYEDAKAWLQES